MNKKKLPYVKPRCEVYTLPQQPRLLQVSGRDPYAPTDDNPFSSN